MAKIEGYFLYHISSNISEEFWFIYPYKVYSTLQGAKNAKIINDKTFTSVKNSTWFIIPIKYAYDRKSKIKYMYINGHWSTDIDDNIANEFYKWRDR